MTFLRVCLASLLLWPTLATAEVKIQEVVSPGGITAWLVEEPSIPFVAMDIRFVGGAAIEPAEVQGSTYLMMGLLEEGAGDMDNRAFAEAEEALAASFGFEVFRDTAQVTARFLTENQDESVALLKAALTEPTFAPDAVERVRSQVLSIIESNARDPEEIASETLNRLAFEGHPYARTIEGTPSSVAGLTIDDLRDAHQRALTKDRVYVGVTGDITPDELGPLLDTLLGDLPQSSTALPDKTEFGLAGGTTVVDFPSPQSVVLFGHAGLDFEHPDYLTAMVMNHVLGAGGFGSRLTEEVRVKRGLTYGIGSFLVPRDYAALILGQASLSNENVPEALDVIKTQWAEMAKVGISQQELDQAITYLTGAYPLRFDGNARIAGILAGMQISGLPIDYIPGRNDRVRAITLDDVNRVASELLDPDALHFVIVGQPVGLKQDG